MINSVIIQLCAIVYILLLGTIYFSKKKIDSMENKIYKYTVVINFICLILDITSVFTIYYYNGTLLNEIMSKMYLISILLWLTTLNIYIFVISIKDNQNVSLVAKKVLAISIIFVLVFSAIVSTCDIKFVCESGKIYSYGESTSFIYIVTELFIGVWLVRILTRFKYIKKKKIPISLNC